MTEMEKQYSNKQFNLHCHSFYCGHGEGEVDEFCQAAINAGLEVLGESEHCPLPDDRYGSTRMQYAQLDNYIHDCRAAEAKHAGSLIVFCGAECDWVDEYRNYYEDELLGKKGLDYALLSVHYVFDENNQEQLVIRGKPLGTAGLSRYTDKYIKGLESGLFLFGCHPDLFGMMYRQWDANSASCSRAIIQAALELDIPLEINGLGMKRKTDMEKEKHESQDFMYPVPQFWEIAAEYGVKVIVNSDSHRPEDVYGEGRRLAEAFALDMGVRRVSMIVRDGRPSVV
ncbi:MAG: histidinol-phosphatase [Spirochaetales bacterium]|jgi:histidinol-phosphatase (PHP family)|nr:histidinol-phosphatase [Spirochaetales bacterium]